MHAIPATQNSSVNSFADVPMTATNEDLLKAVRRALVDRHQVVDIGEKQIRFQQGGDVFEHDGNRILALNSGIYAFLPVSFGGRNLPAQWSHLGPVEQMDIQIKQFLPTEENDRKALLTRWNRLEGAEFDAKVTSMKSVGGEIGVPSGAIESRHTEPRRPTPFDANS